MWEIAAALMSHTHGGYTSALHLLYCTLHGCVVPGRIMETKYVKFF